MSPPCGSRLLSSSDPGVRDLSFLLSFFHFHHLLFFLSLLPNPACFGFENRYWTYTELNVLANKIANWALSKGIKRGDTVSLFLENSPEFLATVFAMAKIGVGEDSDSRKPPSFF